MAGRGDRGKTLTALKREPAFLKPHLQFAALLALFSALVLLPLRTGDLAGYDDALYAHIAKHIVRSGDWVNLDSNGLPALEHPPLLDWMEAALFSIFHPSDGLARLPAALCGIGAVALVYWIAMELTGSTLGAVLAVFVMVTSAYFVKYASRGMTDAPFTFFFLAAIYAWLRAAKDSRWYLAAGALTGCAQMTRGLMGFALPAIFLIHLVVSRRRAPVAYLIAASILAFGPLALWYAHMIRAHGQFFFRVHSEYLNNAVYGQLSPRWRKYTGAFEYAWMLTKSYWPWLPAMIAGLIVAVRRRDRRLWLLVIWAGVVFVLCAAAKSRVLRYMLPAYPAFALLSAIALERFVPHRYLQRGLAVLVPLTGAVFLWLAFFPRTHWEALETRPIAMAVSQATPAGERFGFYDEGQPRIDETNQFQWYGERNLDLILNHDELLEDLEDAEPSAYVVDRKTYENDVRPRPGNRLIAEKGHLVCFRVEER